MKLWRKVGSGFKSNILILITVALWHKVTQSADTLAHLISFMSWRIWISQDTRVKQKVISASSAVSKPCGVEVKLQVKIVITNPLSPSHITESTQLFGTVENSPTEFSVESPTWIRTISRGDNWREDWIRLCRWFPQHEHFSRSRPLQCFTSLFSSHVFLAGLLPCSYRRLHSTMLMM